jgi:hypothetical protein
MCMGIGGPPYGIPILGEIQEQYTDEVKAAWEKFDAWWKTAQDEAIEAGVQVSRASMPEDVREAMDLILETPIPTYADATGRDSCYMVGVQAAMVD